MEIFNLTRRDEHKGGAARCMNISEFSQVRICPSDVPTTLQKTYMILIFGARKNKNVTNVFV